MTLQNLHPEQTAKEWDARIANGLRDAGFSDDEIAEVRQMVFSLTHIAVEQLIEDPTAKIPTMNTTLEIDEEKAQNIIGLFIRGMNQIAWQLRQIEKPSPMPWPERAKILETAAWEVFNLAKLLVALQNTPNPVTGEMLNSEKDLQLIMKRSITEILERHLASTERTLHQEVL